MKKNFFKKLSFVMALAMMVSMVAPAASALGATDPSLYVAKKYLYLQEEGKISEYDFNIKNKVAGSTYAWSSDNEAAVVVDEATGLASAVAVGTAHVTVTVTFKDDTTKDLTATVVVRDNIETIDVSNVPTTDLTVGKEYDFNRSFVTFNGSTKKTSSLSRWTVDKTTATIAADSGKFTATEAGEYKVTVNAFQSNAQYLAWKADPVANATLVKATKTVTVKVAVGITKVELVTPSKIKVTFDSSVKDIVKTVADVKVEQKLTGTYTAMVPVSSIDSVSEDGKTVVFSTYDALADKQTYKVTAAGASTELYALVGTPVSIVLNDQIIPAGVSTKIAYQLLDANGVDVSASYSVDKNSSVPFDNAAAGTITLGDGVVSFVEYSYTILKSDGTSTTITTGVKSVKGVSATVGTALEWNVNGSEDFSKTTQTVKVGATDQNIYGRIKKSDGTYTASSTYTYTSLTPSVLLIDSFNDRLIPVAAGTALVKVMDGTNLVSYINLVVLAAPATQSIKADTQSFTLSNNISGTPEHKTVTIKAIDQYAAESDATIQDSYVVSADHNTLLANIAVVGATVTFTAVDGKTGTFTYYVKAADKTTLITVTVAAPGTLTSYVINATESSLDSYEANTNTASETTFTVYGVDANGIKKQLVQDMTATSGVAVKYTVTNGEGTAQAGANAATFTGAAVFAVNDADGTVEKNGTYTFTVSIGGIKYAKTFTVTNSRPAPVATIVKITTNAGSGSAVVNAIADMITLKLGDNAVAITSAEFLSTNSTIAASNGASFLTTGTVTLYVTKVTTMAGGVAQDVAINRSFTVTVQ